MLRKYILLDSLRCYLTNDFSIYILYTQFPISFLAVCMLGSHFRKLYRFNMFYTFNYVLYNSLVEILACNVMWFGNGVLGQWLGLNEIIVVGGFMVSTGSHNQLAVCILSLSLTLLCFPPSLPLSICVSVSPQSMRILLKVNFLQARGPYQFWTWKHTDKEIFNLLNLR